jgi:membrane protease YdiL (CAAX protease family)
VARRRDGSSDTGWHEGIGESSPGRAPERRVPVYQVRHSQEDICAAPRGCRRSSVVERWNGVLEDRHGADKPPCSSSGVGAACRRGQNGPAVTGAVEVVATLLFAYVVIVVPILGRSRYEQFRREVAKDPSARLRYYRSSLPRKYILALLVVVLFVANHRDASGIRLAVAGPTALAAIVPIMIGVGLGALLVRWRANRPARRIKLARSLRGIADLLPRTVGERRTWVLVAITAGVTEELIYRGFVLSVLAHIWPSADTFTLLVVGGIIFGLAHLYQGTKGVILTGLLGVVLGEVMIGAGLFAAMVVHALIDLRVLVIPSNLSLDPAPGGTDSTRDV